MIYKYLCPERTDVLEKQQIRFSPAISMNDVFELKPLMKGWASKEMAKPILIQKLNDFFSKANTPEKMLQTAIANHPDAEGTFRETMRRLGPERWLQEMHAYVQRNFESEAENIHTFVEQNWGILSANLLALIGTQIGILSLSEDAKNPAMWGNYADSSRGFVIGFDESHSWFHQKRTEDDEFYHLRKVSYLRDVQPKYFSELTAQDIGYSKLEIWSYEKEWRIIFPLARGIRTTFSDTFGQPVILFPFPAECVGEIIIGSRATAELSGKIEDIQKNTFAHATVSKGSW